MVHVAALCEVRSMTVFFVKSSCRLAALTSYVAVAFLS